MGKTKRARSNGGPVGLIAIYERQPTGAWLARLERDDVAVAAIGPAADMHDIFHGVLTEISDRCRRLDMRHVTLHVTADGGPEQLALIAARGGWFECRDSLCVADPVRDDDAEMPGDVDHVPVMTTASLAGSECPPQFRAEQDDLHRRALERYGPLIRR